MKFPFFGRSCSLSFAGPPPVPVLVVELLGLSATSEDKSACFGTTQPSPKKINPTPAMLKSKVVPAAPDTSACQINSTDKAAEALHYLV